MTPSHKFFKFLTAAIFLMLAGAYAASAFAETMYVKRAGTKLQAAGSAQSSVLGLLNQGAAVNVLSKSGRFYKVSVGGKTGWVFRFKLSARPPAGGGGGGGDFLGAVGGQQMAAREAGTGSSIRGLSPTSEKHAKSKGISETTIRSVKEMEAFRVTRGDLDKFLQQGKLGEYGQ